MLLVLLPIWPCTPFPLARPLDDLATLTLTQVRVVLLDQLRWLEVPRVGRPQLARDGAHDAALREARVVERAHGAALARAAADEDLVEPVVPRDPRHAPGHAERAHQLPARLFKHKQRA
eukprot:361853-Chlamydomonas_euryale.AAC.4